MTIPAALLRMRLLDPVDQLALVIALPEFDREAVFLAGVPAQLFHVLECGAAVDLRLAGAEQVQVRTVQDVNRRHAWPFCRAIDAGREGAGAPAGIVIGGLSGEGKPEQRNKPASKGLPGQGLGRED